LTYRGRVEKGVVLLEDRAGLPVGTEAGVQPLGETQGAQVRSGPSPLSGEFWRARTVAELAEQQGVTAPGDLDDLAGDWPDD